MRYLPTLTITFAAILVAAGGAVADDTFCPPNLGAVTVDNVIADNGACNLSSTIVQGNVLVEPGGSLVSQGSTRVGGSVQLDGGTFVALIQDTRVAGDVQIKGATVGSGYAGPVIIGGSFQAEGNSGVVVAVGGTVGGDLQVFKNTGGGLIGQNTVGGNLQCTENDPAPVPFVAANTVSGNKEDQCAADLGF